MKILVLGGTGTVGSQLVRELLVREVDAYVLTRSPDRAKHLPAGAHAVIGDMLDPATVRSAFKGMDAAFLLAPVSTTETHEGLMALDGARMAGVKRVVYLSVQNVDKAPHIPHFGSKIPVEIAIKASGIPYTILRPNDFYQNDYWSRDAILEHGVYPQPIGDVGLSRVDVRDIAAIAAITLTTGGHEGETYNLVGPDVQTGRSTADLWSLALGRTISYGGNDLDAWEQRSLAYQPAWLVFDMRLMYAFLQEHGLRATPGDIDRVTALLGREPRSFENFATETARMWMT
jgi:uncharacterized protein YbjT (DUF2867 family)